MNDRIERVESYRRQDMSRSFQPICCDECAVEITWTPVIIDGRPYCCHDCAVGLECNCASLNSTREDEIDLFWMGNTDGNVEAAYGIDYSLD
jgi:hypothetical protein